MSVLLKEAFPACELFQKAIILCTLQILMWLTFLLVQLRLTLSSKTTYKHFTRSLPYLKDTRVYLAPWLASGNTCRSAALSSEHVF